MKTKVVQMDDNYYYILCKKHFWSPWRFLMHKFDDGKEFHGEKGYIFRCWVKGQANAIAKRVQSGDFGIAYYIGVAVVIKRPRHGNRLG